MQRAWDVSGIGLSALCLAHCLALPAISVTLPLFAGVAEAEWVHWLVVVLAAPVALAAIAPRLRERPLPWLVAILSLAGVSLLFSAIAFAPETLETTLTVIGGIMLVTAHAQNWRRTRHRHGLVARKSHRDAMEHAG